MRCLRNRSPRPADSGSLIGQAQSPVVLTEQSAKGFDDQGVVRAVDHKVLQDGKEITPVARATPAPGRELSFLEQLIGNLGKFNSSGGGSSGGGGGSGPQGPRPTDTR